MDVDESLTWPDGTVDEVRIAHTTSFGFALAHVPPRLRRSRVEGDANMGAPPVIVIGYEVWNNRFAADPDVLGTDLRIGGAPHRVVGVMPEGARRPTRPANRASPSSRICIFRRAATTMRMRPLLAWECRSDSGDLVRNDPFVNE